MSHREMESFRSILQQRLDAIMSQSREAVEGTPLEFVAYADMADRAAMESDRHLLLLLRERDRILAEEIKEALARLDAGEYGLCLECGEEIGQARLRAQPTASLCVHCKTLLEDGRMFRACQSRLDHDLFEDAVLA